MSWQRLYDSIAALPRLDSLRNKLLSRTRLNFSGSARGSATEVASEFLRFQFPPAITSRCGLARKGRSSCRRRRPFSTRRGRLRSRFTNSTSRSARPKSCWRVPLRRFSPRPAKSCWFGRMTSGESLPPRSHRTERRSAEAGRYAGLGRSAGGMEPDVPRSLAHPTRFPVRSACAWPRSGRRRKAVCPVHGKRVQQSRPTH